MDRPIAFSRAGAHVLTVSGNCTGSAWERRRARALAALEGHTAELTGDVPRRLHPSGHAARDGTAKIERVVQVTQDLIDDTQGVVPQKEWNESPRIGHNARVLPAAHEPGLDERLYDRMPGRSIWHIAEVAETKGN